MTAALPGLTAREALVEHSALKAGDRVLVHGSAGGVGAFVTQLATALGARVTGTAHTKDVAYVGSLGAERVIDVDHEAVDAETGASSTSRSMPSVALRRSRCSPRSDAPGTCWLSKFLHPAGVGRPVRRHGRVLHREA